MAFPRYDTEETIQIPVPTPCDLCDSEDEVNSYCRNCGQKLCDVCKKTHLRITTTRDHVVVHISEGPCLTDEPSICREHGQTLTFYCRTCDNLTCPKCLVVHHKGHDFVDTDGYAEEVREKSKELISQTEDEKQRNRQNLESVEEAQEKYLREMKTCKDSVRNVTKRMFERLREIEKGLLSKISEKESSDLAIFEDEKKRIKDREIDLEKSINKLKLGAKSKDTIALIRSTKLNRRKFSSASSQSLLDIVPFVHVYERSVTDLEQKVGFLQPKESLQRDIGEFRPPPDLPFSIPPPPDLSFHIPSRPFRRMCGCGKKHGNREIMKNKCKNCGKPLI